MDAGNVPQIWLFFMYTLNRKSTINSKENKACLELGRQYSKRVANHSNISGRKLFKFSSDICVKIFQDIIHDFRNCLSDIQMRIENLPPAIQYLRWSFLKKLITAESC